MKLRTMIVAGLLALLLTSCGTKQHAMNQLKGFSTELQKNSGDYSLEDWKEAGNKFVKIHKKLKKYDYTTREKLEIAKLELQCAKYAKEGAIESAPGVLLDLGSEFGEILDEIKDIFK